MTKRLCYISKNYRSIDGSGNKAKTDNEATLRLLGAHNLGLKTTYYDSKFLSFFLDLAGVVKCLFTIRRGDVLFLQYPLKKYFSFLCRVAKWRNASSVALIHDLGSMRRKRLTVEHEIKRLMNADVVIASNETMKEWLSEHGFKNKLGALGLFDYRSESHPSPRTTSPSAHYTLVYAGALAKRKNTFLLKMKPEEWNCQINIYGNSDGLPDLKESAYLHVRGFMKADEFIAHVDGDFGLVWDGDSIDSCTGNFGEYLHWNSPHKVSFYLRAGLPVIIWKEAAVAPIVEQENIGIAIASLNELGERLSALTAEDINAMRKNVERISQKLASGGFLQEALKQTFEQTSFEKR